MSKPMNVIFVTSDEMRGDAPGFMGNSDCKTPNLDRFAEKGIAFECEYTVHGKCVPSRIAAETGRYCHTDGIRTINLHLPPDAPNLLGRLKQEGYESACFGLNHVWDEKLFWNGNKKGGYVDYQSFTDGDFHEMTKKVWDPPPANPDGPEPIEEMKGNMFHYNGRGTKPISGMCDHNRAEQAVHYLKNVRDRTRPFYLRVNFSTPHPGYGVEEPWYSMYDRNKINPWPYDVPENAPLPIQKMREVRTGIDIPEKWLREIQATYYGMVSRVDSHIGQVLDAIEDQGLFENSIVIFWVDHGDFAGQYGLPEKWDTAMNDCIMHVPQILWAPGLPRGKRVDSLTEHVDLCPTILELLGLEPGWGIHGESLLPIINGEKRKDAVFGDGGHEEEMWKRFSNAMKGGSGKQITYCEYPETMSRTKMVRTDKWKLVVRLTGGNELYDMKNDPNEMKNLYPDYEKDGNLKDVVRDLQLKIIQWCLRTDTDRPFEEKVGA